MTTINWADISYLQTGTPRQQAAYTTLHTLELFPRLRSYSPVLAGTVPLDIDTPESDLDIICEARDLSAFERDISAAFGTQTRFTLVRKAIGSTESVVARFRHNDFLLELFGQPRPVKQQNAYRHMLVESRLLAIGGDPARQAIREMKRTGMKTEPAFAAYFNLKGDPYQVLLELSWLDVYELRSLIARRRYE